jgi:hypothetical protein
MMKANNGVRISHNRAIYRDTSTGIRIRDNRTRPAMIRNGAPTSRIYHCLISDISIRRCINGISINRYPAFSMIQTIGAPIAPYLVTMPIINGTARMVEIKF